MTSERIPPAARQAAALEYRAGVDVAPRVTAVGEGPLAEEIIRRAQQAGVTITRDEQLVALLSKFDVGQVIPPDLYLVVAEILAYVYRLEARLAERRGPRPNGPAEG